MPLAPTMSYMSYMTSYTTSYTTLYVATYDIVYDMMKIYDIVGFWTVLANRTYDVTYNVVYDIVGFLNFPMRSNTIFMSHIGIIRLYVKYDVVGAYRPKRAIYAYDVYIRYRIRYIIRYILPGATAGAADKVIESDGMAEHGHDRVWQ